MTTVSSAIKTINDLPTPKGKFLSGHLKDFTKPNKHQVMEDWVDECGDLFQINFFGKKIIVSADVDINEEVLRSRPGAFRRFSKIDEIMREMGVVGVFNAEGEEWKIHRKITQEALSKRNVNGFFPHLENITKRLLTQWNKKAEEGTVFDVQKEFMKYTVDITTLIAFSYDTNLLEDSNDILQKHLERIFPMINARITAPLPLWRLYRAQKDRLLDESLEAIETKVLEYISIAKEKLKDADPETHLPSDFLEALIIETKKSDGFTDKEVYGNVFSMLLAGEDTTSNTLSWILFYLGQHPEIQQKICDESQATFGDAPMANSADQLSKLKYSEAVAQEALRIKPVTPTLFMQANEDVVINGLAIKKDGSIFMQNKVPQTRESNFSEPDAFVPERWMIGGCPHFKQHNTAAIKAFGGGPRFCPGKQLAMEEMKMAISMICKNYEVKLAVKPSDVKERFAFTMFPDGLNITLDKRN